MIIDEEGIVKAIYFADLQKKVMEINRRSLHVVTSFRIQMPKSVVK